MKIYIVTSGCYSDYHIEAVFTKEKQARMYANLDSEREVEEYDADEIDVEQSITERVWYEPLSDRIVLMNPISYHMGDIIHCNQYIFNVKISGRVMDDVACHGKDSPLLLKIARDRWAQYKAEHMDEIEAEMDDEEEVVTISPEQSVAYFRVLFGMINAGKEAKNDASQDPV